MKYVANGACCMSAGACFAQNMRRADRLFQIVQLIRGRRLSTAAFPGRAAGSVATHHLPRRGRPAAPGRAHRRRSRRGLPPGRVRAAPLMFSQGEANALVAAARLAQAWLDPGLAREVEGAWARSCRCFPAARLAAEAQALYAPWWG